MTESKHYSLIVLGSGPAGLTAALYAARAELHPLVISGIFLHGQAALTTAIENYPGFPEGIGGQQLGQLFQQQAEKFGAQVIYDQVLEVNLKIRPFQVRTYSESFAADSLIITTGADPKKLKIPGEKELLGRGVSYCATCDGAFYRNKEVAVIGGGDSALEEAIFLTRFASKVSIIHRRDKLRAGAILESRARKNPKIEFIWDTIITEINGSDKVDSIKLLNVKSGDTSNLTVEGVFIFIGHTPNSAMFEGQLELDKDNYIKIDNLMQTSVNGVFAAGEIADPIFRQVITSAGMGAAAAMQAIRYLESLQE